MVGVAVAVGVGVAVAVVVVVVVELCLGEVGVAAVLGLGLVPRHDVDGGAALHRVTARGGLVPAVVHPVAVTAVAVAVVGVVGGGCSGAGHGLEG